MTVGAEHRFKLPAILEYLGRARIHPVIRKILYTRIGHDEKKELLEMFRLPRPGSQSL